MRGHFISELRFESIGAPGRIPELEFWAVDEEPHAPADLASAELPRGFAILSPAIKSEDIEPSDCKTFKLDLSRYPTSFAKTHLVFDAEGIFRSFELKRSINGLAEVGGTWLAGGATKRTFVEEIDPATLHLGVNEISLCVPDGASRGVAITNLHVVGESDRGKNLAAAASIGEHARDARQLLDGDSATTTTVHNGEQLLVAFDRLIAPDVLTLSGKGLEPSAVSSIGCVPLKGDVQPITVNRRTGSGDVAIELDGGARQCAAISIAFSADTTLAAVDVLGSGAGDPVDWPRVVVTSLAEHFGDRAWVAGFIARPTAMSGAIRVDVADARQPVMTGDFGTLVKRTDGFDAAWPVSILAKFPDGSSQTNTTILNGNRASDLQAVQAAGDEAAKKLAQSDSAFAREGDSSVGRAEKLKAASIRLGTNVGIDVPIGAVDHPTNITIRHLGEDVLPPLDPGLINVTAPKGHGFEFLPHGQRFAKEVEVVVPYDPSLIPEGMKPEDVHTFFYDPVEKHWKQLDRRAIDVGQKVLRSATNHFTVMIDGVLTVPKNSSPLSLDPTALTSIAAASPAANVDLIEPPSANSSGDARLSLPIRMPPGRGAYSPSLALSYSSSGGEGWLGMGWDLSMSRIEIDTRWGVPKYTADEEPRYVLDGAELVPTLDDDGAQAIKCQDGRQGRRYHTRIEGAFAYILRCDHAAGGINVASHYGWELHDRNGTLFVYGVEDGRDPNTDPRASALVDPQEPHGIFRWSLRKVVDVNGNTTVYDYVAVNDNGSQPGRDTYPEKIEYTSGKNDVGAAFSVEFELDSGNRPDPIISGRPGFKMATRHLLRRVSVKFGTQIIRDYVLSYRLGQFDKTVLERVQVFGVGGCTSASLYAFSEAARACGAFFNEHKFDWYTETTAFSPPQLLAIGGTEEQQKFPLLRGHSNAENGGLDVGLTDPGGNSANAGASLSNGFRDELVGMYDMNGDGLPDETFISGDLAVDTLLNQSGPGLNPSTLFEPRPNFVLQGLTGMAHENRFSWGVKVGGSNAFGASIEGGISNNTAESKRFLTDLNGDGYTDFLSPGFGARLGHPCPQGMCFENAPFAAVDDIDPTRDPLLSEFKHQIKERLVLADPVVRWAAPWGGHVRVYSTARRLQTGSHTVAVELYNGDELLSAATLPGSATAEAALATGLELDVSAGDSLFLRTLGGGDDGAGPDGKLEDIVDAGFRVEYDQICDQLPCDTVIDGSRAHDPSGLGAYTFDSRADFRLAGTPNVFVAPTAGTLRIRGVLTKFPTSADARFCLQRFSPNTESFNEKLADVPCKQTTAAEGDVLQGTFALPAAELTPSPIVADVVVGMGDVIVLRVESDMAFDPRAVVLTKNLANDPLFSFTEVCEPGDTEFECTSDPAELATYSLPDPKTFGPSVALTQPYEARVGSPYVVPDDGGVHTLRIGSIGFSGDNWIFAIRSDRQGLIGQWSCDVFPCAPIDLTSLSVSANESITFELVRNGLLFGSTEVTARLDNSDDEFTIPIIEHGFGAPPKEMSPMAGGFHGFGAALWNEAEVFAPAEALHDFANWEFQTNDRKNELRRQLLSPVSLFSGNEFTSSQPAWFGPHSFAFISGSRLNPGYLGLVMNPSDATGSTVTESGGLLTRGYARLSGTWSGYLSVGISTPTPVLKGSLHLTVTKSSTTTTTDVVDMNGDGISDVVTSDKTTFGAFSTDPTAGGASHAFGFLDDALGGFRRRRGFDYTLGANASGAASPCTTAGGRTIEECFAPAVGLNTNIGFSSGYSWGIGRSETTHDLADINGDGLPDVVRRSGTKILVKLNLGNRFGAEEEFGTAQGALTEFIDEFENDVEKRPLPDFIGHPLDTTSDALEHSTTITQSRTQSFSVLVYSRSKTTEISATRVTRQLVDINGDGKPDLVEKRGTDPNMWVQINRGADFAAPVEWVTPAWQANGVSIKLAPDFQPTITQLELSGPDVLGGTGVDEGKVKSHSAQLLIPTPTGIVNVGGSIGNTDSKDSYVLALMDINGDGAPEHVLRRTTVGGTPTIYMKENQVSGRANLLRQVSRPLGSTITVDYQRVGNTEQMPHSRQVLSSVVVDDGVNLGAEFASPNLSASFTYAGGAYQRNEKEFYGFHTVTTHRADDVTIEDEYSTDLTNYALHGRLLRETRKKNTTVLEESRTTYEVRDVKDGAGNVVGPDPACVSHLHALLGATNDACTPRLPVVVRTEDELGEGGTATKVHITQDLEYDRFGNELSSLDGGDAAIGSDDVFVRVTYANDTQKWILGRPVTIEVRSGGSTGVLLRSRSGTYNDFGQPITLTTFTGTANATTTLAYDVFGNLESLETPPNEQGERQKYTMQYEPQTRMYPVEAHDKFGYSSTAAYDLRFGVATTETDVNHQQIVKTLDAFGRLSTVRGPYESVGSPALTMSYDVDSVPARATTVTHPSPPPGYTGPALANLTTITTVDGLGRAITLDKTAFVNGTPGMITSGLVSRDAIGRVIRSFNPYFRANATSPVAFPEAHEPTLTEYDAFDRATRTTYADGAIESTAFEVATAPGGVTLFHSVSTAANGHIRESWTDHLGRVRAFVEHPDATNTALSTVTRYDYLPTGELLSIVDAEGNQTSMTYDMRGLRTSMANPDTGLIEDKYDAMGNRIALIEPNHRALGAGVGVHFIYEFNRLKTIDYPSKHDVTYVYGAATEFADGLAGRLKKVDDESGSQEFKYGALGEMRETKRTVLPDQQGSQPLVFLLRQTTDSLGRQLRIVYPDGVTIDNTFDQAGQLASVVGTGNGWSRTYASDIRYDQFGNRSHLRYGNGVVSDWTYDPKRIRLQSVVTKLPSQTNIQNLSYEYDASSNPLKITNALAALTGGSGNQPGDSILQLTYDGVDRLTRAVGDAQLNAQKRTQYDEAFGYSASHNLVHKQRTHIITQPSTVPSVPRATNFSSDYSYSSARPHLPAQVGELLITYDGSGNPITRRTLSTGNQQNLVWDDDNRLVDYTNGGVHQHNTYDASGVRVRRKSGTGETVYVSQYFDVDNGTQGVRHVFAGGLRVASEVGKFTSTAIPVAPTKAGTAYFFHPDHLGSTSVVTAQDGSVHESLEYFTDGELWLDRAPQNPVNKYLFSGKPFDPDTGFYDFGQRFYEPRTSLWLGIDPEVVTGPEGAIRNPLQLSVSAYAANNPIANGDPDGRSPVCMTTPDGSKHCTSDFPLPRLPDVYFVDPWTNQKEYEDRLWKAWGNIVEHSDRPEEIDPHDLLDLAGALLVYYEGFQNPSPRPRAAPRPTIPEPVTTGEASPPAQDLQQAPAPPRTPRIRPGNEQPMGGNGRVLADGEGATPQEIAASRGGPTGGSRATQRAVRRTLIQQADATGQPYRCWRCGQTSTNPADMHVGHRNVPKSLGGNLDPVNVCLEGAACNMSAGNRGSVTPGRSCAERGSCGAPFGR